MTTKKSPKKQRQYESRWGRRLGDQRRTAIIDIGSNSIRLVLFEGAARAPSVVFNEKVMAGLGVGLATTGLIDQESMDRGIAALRRFRLLIDTMQVDTMRCVATAAVRDALNGREFIRRVAKEAGLTVQLLSGEQEAAAAGYGVLAAIPNADGIVADLGGGSLELVRVRNGEIGRRCSFPLGVLRVAAMRAKSEARFPMIVGKMLLDAGWPGSARNLPLYLVGGSWRSLARVHMAMTKAPLPILHGYEMDPRAAQTLRRTASAMTSQELKQLGALPSGRAYTLADAAALLVPLVKILQTSKLVISSSGLREGLVYQGLSAPQRRVDPLVAAAETEGARLARFDPHGRLLYRWMDPLFAKESDADQRLRLVACLLSDVAWTANPDFRANLAFEIGLHGNWTAIDLPERVILAQALWTGFGGGSKPLEHIARLAPPERIDRAIQWGHAIRLGQRLSGGTAPPLRATRLNRKSGYVHLFVEPDKLDLAGELVERRLVALAHSLGCGAIIHYGP